MNSIYLSEDKFTKYLGWAIAVHIGLVGSILLIHFVMGWEFLASREFKTEMLQPSVRVDIVAMPKFTVQELKQMKVEPAPAAPEDKAGEEKKTEEKVEEATPQPQVDLGNILKNLSKKEVTPKVAPAKQVKGPSINTQALKNLVLEGNKVSQGAAVVGDAYAKEQTEYSAYVGSLPDYLRPHWKLPSYLLENKSLSCWIKIYIDGNGKVMRTEVVKSSGVGEYDQKALQAITAASLPPPGREILSKVSSGSVVLGFPL